MTKTSPIVAAALSCQEEEDDFLLAEEKRNNSSISDKTKHKLIKQVHDSMDNLKNQLLNKGMCQYAADVESLNKNLETTAKKQDELDRIKLEQENIRIEKVKYNLYG